MISNEELHNLQRLAPEAESRHSFHAAQIPTPISGRKSIEESGKAAVGIIASKKSTIVPPLPLSLTSVASSEFEEHDTLLNNGDESGHDR